MRSHCASRFQHGQLRNPSSYVPVLVPQLSPLAWGGWVLCLGMFRRAQIPCYGPLGLWGGGRPADCLCCFVSSSQTCSTTMSNLCASHLHCFKRCPKLVVFGVQNGQNWVIETAWMPQTHPNPRLKPCAFMRILGVWRAGVQVPNGRSAPFSVSGTSGIPNLAYIHA